MLIACPNLKDGSAHSIKEEYAEVQASLEWWLPSRPRLPEAQ